MWILALALGSIFVKKKWEKPAKNVRQEKIDPKINFLFNDLFDMAESPVGIFGPKYKVSVA